MDKKILRNFAINARQIMENDTRVMLGQFGITDKEIVDPSPKSDRTMLLFDIGRDEPNIVVGKKIDQYKKLLSEIEHRSFEKDYRKAINQLIEEVSYTWFNRIIAIRFMEVNGFLADNIRILSSAKEGINEPDIVSNFEYSTLDIGDDEKKVLIEKRYGQAKDLEELFQELFIKTCNKLNESLPDLFEKTDDYAELLLNISYSDPNGVIRKLIDEVPEDYFNVSNEGAFELFGWIYQFYNDESKEKINSKPNSHKITSEELPIITQLYTPDWIVKYMVQNSLGRLWVNNIEDENNFCEDNLIYNFRWKYYIKGNEIIKNEIQLEEVKVIDPAMGSGHILLYAFDLLMEIYLSQGYTKADASKFIVERNLYGLDIDMRAYQIAYFSLMMKGRLNDRNFLKKDIQINLDYFVNSDEIKSEQLEYFGNNLDTNSRKSAEKQILEIIKLFENADELGSIIKLENSYDINLLDDFLNDLYYEQVSLVNLNINYIQSKLIKIVHIVSILNKKYEVVVTNPPYLGASKFNKALKNYSTKNYKDSKGDLYSIFIEVCLNLTKNNYFTAMITMHGWMFLTTYELLRKKLLSFSIENMVHLGTNAFEEIDGEVVQTVAYVINKSNPNSGNSIYLRLVDYNNISKKEKAFLNKQINSYTYSSNQDDYKKIPGTPIAYWASDSIIKDFEKSLPMNEFLEPKVGLQTGDNSRFLRLWWEVLYGKIKFDTKDRKEAINSNSKWFPYNKGGNRRKWYGNYDYVVNWEDDGKEIRNFTDDKGKQRSRPQNTDYYFRNAISWNLITTGGFSSRYRDYGSIHDVSGMSAFGDSNNIFYSLGLTNTKLSNNIFTLLNPTINLQVGDFNNFPVLLMDDKEKEKDVINITVDNIDISKAEWNSYETAWDFTTSPLLKFNNSLIEQSLELLIKERETMIEEVRKNEEDLNVIFTYLYNLNDEIDTHVSREEITLRDVTRESAIKDFISYAVGCMFGRYSLDKEGLVLAGREIDYSNYKIYTPDKDNVIIICEDYIEDDIVEKFQEFVRVAFGDENFEENIDFIADSLGGKGTSLDKIRNYFIKDFFKDHAKNYSVIGSGRRPIYWLYDSGKQKAFKALIYMHRYDKDTTGRVRVDYLHKVQRMYEERLDQNQNMIEILDSARDKTRLEKENEVYRKKLDEIRDYDKKIAVLADMRIDIDLDDGVKINHQKIQIDKDGNNLQILAKI